MAREGLDEAVEGHDQRQRVGQRMAGRGEAAASCALDASAEVMKTDAPLPASRSAASATEGSAASRAASASDREARLDERQRPVHHLGRAVGLGMHGAGFLELQRRLVGDGRATGRDRGRRANLARPSSARIGERRSSRSRSPSARCSGRSCSAASSAVSSVQCASSARPATAELTKLFVAATLFSSPASMSMAWSEASASGEPGVLVSAMVSAPPARAGSRHGDDVGALAGLRDRRGRRRRRASVRAVDRGDRRPERGDRHAGGQFDRIFEEGRGMVGRAARDGDDDARVAGRAAPRRRSASAPPEASSRRAAASGISSISRRMWVVSHVWYGSFMRVGEPELGDEIIGVAPIDRAGEFDDLAARQIGDALDGAGWPSRRGTSSSRASASSRLAARDALDGAHRAIAGLFERGIERVADRRRDRAGSRGRARRARWRAACRRRCAGAPRAPRARWPTGRAPSSLPGEGE